MRPTVRQILVLVALSISLSVNPASISIAAANEDVEAGRKLAFDRKKGNCLACHMMQGGALPGNIGPPLIAMKARFPDRAALRAQVWDSTVKNPNSMMPPFGKHGILNEREVDLVVEFVLTL